MSDYLAIKNWEKYQGAYTRSYIRDYSAQGSDEDYCKLTFFQRHVLQEVRRIRGRIGRNVPYDLHYICRESAATTPDKPRINAALTRLIHDGWLVVTNQQDDEPIKPIKRREKSKREEKKPSAPATPRGPVDNSRIAKMSGETRHTRMREMVSRWYLEWAGQECPWDGSEAKQLDSMLKATPKWMDSQFVGCLVNLALSDCIPKGDRPREWLGKLPKFLHGPLDQWWKPKGAANGNGQISKAQQRHERNDEKYRRVLSELSPGAGRDLPLGDGGRGTRALPGEPELLPPPRGKTGWPPSNDSSA